MIVTCHQPNFVPWNPFFEKIRAADVVVLLNHVQFTRHQFQNRFKFQNKWCTMSVNHGSLKDLINEKVYTNPISDWQRIKNQIGYTWLSEYDELIDSNLSASNTRLIKKMIEQLEIYTQIQSDSSAEFSDPTHKLVEICKEFNAHTYLSGPSGKKYLNLEMFDEAGIEVKFFENSPDTRSILEIINDRKN